MATAEPSATTEPEQEGDHYLHARHICWALKPVLEEIATDSPAKNPNILSYCKSRRLPHPAYQAPDPDRGHLRSRLGPGLREPSHRTPRYWQDRRALQGGRERYRTSRQQNLNVAIQQVPHDDLPQHQDGPRRPRRGLPDHRNTAHYCPARVPSGTV